MGGNPALMGDPDRDYRRCDADAAVERTADGGVGTIDVLRLTGRFLQNCTPGNLPIERGANTA